MENKNLPPDEYRLTVRSIYQSAVRCFFVSQHNLELTQQQIDKRAAESLRKQEKLVPFDLAAQFAERLLQIAREQKLSSTLSLY